jgi:hypothetical protein
MPYTAEICREIPTYLRVPRNWNCLKSNAAANLRTLFLAYGWLLEKIAAALRPSVREAVAWIAAGWIAAAVDAYLACQ